MRAVVEEDDEEKTVDSVWMIGNVDSDPVEKTDGEVVINHVHTGKRTRVGMTEATIDSAADGSVCPLDWGSMFRLEKVQVGEQI